jgi:hypothetical protein
MFVNDIIIHTALRRIITGRKVSNKLSKIPKLFTKSEDQPVYEEKALNRKNNIKAPKYAEIIN